jgi:nitrogen regulatory protein PII
MSSIETISISSFMTRDVKTEKEEKNVITVPGSMAKPIIDDILKVISTGSASDGKIFLYDIAEPYDIGSKETLDVAL